MLGSQLFTISCTTLPGNSRQQLQSRLRQLLPRQLYSTATFRPGGITSSGEIRKLLAATGDERGGAGLTTPTQSLCFWMEVSHLLGWHCYCDLTSSCSSSVFYRDFYFQNMLVFTQGISHGCTTMLAGTLPVLLLSMVWRADKGGVLSTALCNFILFFTCEAHSPLVPSLVSALLLDLLL